MKKLLSFIVFIFLTAVAFSQQFNNEWIDYSKTYYKFKVGATGLYRIPQTTLAASGLANADAAHFQLWRNGVEIPVYTSNPTGALAPGGYIEFWGEANDGKADQALYRDLNDQINDSKSLFTDTAAYFLTVNPTGNNKRLNATANIIPVGVGAEPYFMYTTGIYPNESIHLGPYVGKISEAAISASYEVGEGWTSNEISENQTRTFTQTSLFPFTGSGAPQMQLKLNLVGNSPNSRTVNVALNNTAVFNTSLNGFDYAKLTAQAPVSHLTGATENITFTNVATTSNNRIKIGRLDITYPRIFNFGGASSFPFELSASSLGKYLEISNFNYSGTPLLYDLTNGRRYEANTGTPSVVKIYVQPSVTNARLVLVNTTAANIKIVSGLETRNFIDYAAAANQGDYLMITHENILTGSGGTQPVEAYRAYRSSAAGGGYNAKVYMIDQLIDQFAFGIKYHPLSVRNFLRFARSRFSSAPKSAFLLGHGLKYVSARANESSLTTQRLNLVPTFGTPASDVLLAAEGSSSQPLTPIGRISVINGDELSLYLEKIKEYEQHLTPSPSVGASLWKKNVIHMVGANDQALINELYGALNTDKTHIIDTFYGANVTDFVKSSTPGSDQTTSERLKSRLNTGINLLTYFGHSSSETLAFDLENPLNYSNAGKYPVFHMMGCNVGDIFILNDNRLSTYNTISEKYLFAKGRGSVAMMAGTSVGYVFPLRQYNTTLYKQLTNESYGYTLGAIMNNTIRAFYSQVGGESSLFHRAQAEEYTLNGDPGIRLYQFDKPDYAIEEPMVTISPNIVSVAEPAFTLKAKIANLGRAINDSMIVEIKRTYPDLSVEVVVRDTISGIRYLDSLTYHFPISPLRDHGANKFTITIDPENKINELSKSNNSVVKELFIFEDNISTVFPFDYAIVNKLPVTFIASTGDPFATTKNYTIEIDSVLDFNSPFKYTQTKSSKGGVIAFESTQTFRDSTVYYWRVGLTPTESTPESLWSTASFTYMPTNNLGFSESHADQFERARPDGVNFEQQTRTFTFDSLQGIISITNSIYTTNNQIGARDIALYIGDILAQGGFSGPATPNANQNSIRFYVINNKSLDLLKNTVSGNLGQYGSYPPVEWKPGYTITGFFQFDISNANGRANVMRFMDSIPSGYYVGLTSNQWTPTILPSVWQADTAVFGKNNSLYHKLKSIGLTGIDEVKSEVPYIFFYQKNNSVPLAQVVGNSITDKLKISLKLPVLGTKGKLTSPLFQKYLSVDKMVWDGYSLETPSTDKTSFSVIGVDKNGTESRLIENIPSSQKTLDLSQLNASEFSGIRLQMETEDETNRTPYQIKYWRLYGTPVPEGAIAPNLYFSSKDTLEAGEPFNLGVAFKNVSDQPFDSLKIKLTVRDKNNIEKTIPINNVKPLIAGDTVKLDVPIPTQALAGNNLAYLEFNRDNDQPEQHSFNNFIYKNFYVRGDSLGPNMDVTFDGLHILNRDIVSSKPDIQIKLTDDAKYLLLNNSDLIKVQLRHPDGLLRDYQFNNDTLIFTPAGQGANEANTASVSFKPHLLADGEYELIVSAEDESGNRAGSMDYRINFQVLNKPMISNLLNYPNPFTTSTAFVFTLTGSEIPQNIRIQILTITGKIVREITKSELGPLRIGRNITEFKWDGTDQYGQKLANGVYLYRVLTNLNGKSLDKYRSSDDNTDRYFNKGYGKMVLIR
ncbi:C25 family cysteine peptidase [Niabella insulamsoli]|uniref:putative type IX secretion system sortase PorU2 n=1 Tax=Niabella insulamsoli TaxID=3144874 RepID=UPI0031FD1393